MVDFTSATICELYSPSFPLRCGNLVTDDLCFTFFEDCFWTGSSCSAYDDINLNCEIISSDYCHLTNDRCVTYLPGSCVEHDFQTFSCADISSDVVCSSIDDGSACFWSGSSCLNLDGGGSCSDIGYKNLCESVSSCWWMPDIENISIFISVDNNSIDMETDLSLNISFFSNRTDFLNDTLIRLNYSGFSFLDSSSIPGTVEPLEWFLGDIGSDYSWNSSVLLRPIRGGNNVLTVFFIDSQERIVYNESLVFVFAEEDHLLVSVMSPSSAFLGDRFNLTLNVRNTKNESADNVSVFLNVSDVNIYNFSSGGEEINGSVAWSNQFFDSFEEKNFLVEVFTDNITSFNWLGKALFGDDEFFGENLTVINPLPTCVLVDASRPLYCTDILTESACLSSLEDCFWDGGSCQGPITNCDFMSSQDLCYDTTSVCYWSSDPKPVCEQSGFTTLTCNHITNQDLCSFFATQCFWGGESCFVMDYSIACSNIVQGSLCTQTSNVCDWTGPLPTESFHVSVSLSKEFRVNTSRTFFINISNLDEVNYTNVNVSISFDKLNFTGSSLVADFFNESLVSFTVPEINEFDNFSLEIFFNALDEGEIAILTVVEGGSFPLSENFVTTILPPVYPEINISLDYNNFYDAYFFNSSPIISGVINHADYWNISLAGDITSVICESSDVFSGTLCVPNLSVCGGICNVNMTVYAVNDDGNFAFDFFENVTIDVLAPFFDVLNVSLLLNPKRVGVNVSVDEDFPDYLRLFINASFIHSWNSCNDDCFVSFPPNRYRWGTDDVSVRVFGDYLVVDGCHRPVSTYICGYSVLFNSSSLYAVGIVPSDCLDCDMISLGGLFIPYMYLPDFSPVNKSFKGFSNARLFDFLTGELVSVNVFARDSAGNKNFYSQDLFLDNTIPSIDLVSNLSVIAGVGFLNVSLLVTDANELHSVEAWVDDESCSVSFLGSDIYGANCSFLLPDEPMNRSLIVRATDIQGNSKNESFVFISHNIGIPDLDSECWFTANNSTNTSNSWNHEVLELFVFQNNSCAFGFGADEALVFKVSFYENFSDLENLLALYPLNLSGYIQNNVGFNSSIVVNLSGHMNFTLFNQPYDSLPFVMNFFGNDMNASFLNDSKSIRVYDVVQSFYIYSDIFSNINVLHPFFPNNTAFFEINTTPSIIGNANLSILNENYNLSCEGNICFSELDIVLVEGAYNVTVSSMNRNGLITVVNETIYFDFENPNITVFNPYNNSFYPSPLVVSGVVDDVSFDTIIISVGGFERTISSHEFYEEFFLDDGDYFVNIFSNDSFSRNSSVNLSVVVDSTFPEILFTPNISLIYQNVTSVLVEVNASDEYLENLSLSIHNGSDIIWYYVNESYIIFDDILTDGMYTFIANATDKALNSAVEELIIVVDTVIPSLLVEQVNNITYGDELFFSASSDDGIYFSLYLDSQLISESPSFLIDNLSAGDYSYYWEVRDLAGNINLSDTFYFTVLKKAPDIGFNMPPSSIYGDEISSYTVCPDYLECLIYANNSLFVGETLPVGVYSFSLRTEGNENFTSYEVFQDHEVLKAVPIINFSVGDFNDSVVLQPFSANISFERIFGQSPVDLYLDGSLLHSGLSYVHEFDFLSDDSYVFFIQSNESHNFSEYNYSFTINVDSISPVINVFSPDAGKFSQNGFLLNFSVEDDYFSHTTIRILDTILVYQLTIAEENFSAWINLDEGNYTLELTSFDEAGNEAELIVEEIYLDITGPDIVSSFTPHSSMNSITGFVNASDELFAFMNISIGDFFIHSINESVFLNITNLDDGVYELVIYSEDSLGNNVTYKVPGLIIDSTPPVVDVIYPSDNSIISESVLQIELNVSDLSPFDVFASSGSVNVSSSNPIFIMNLGEGVHDIFVNVTDILGFSSSIFISNITLDVTPPEIPHFGPENNSITTNASVNLVCNAYDDQKLDRVEYTIFYSNGTLLNNSDSVVLPELGEYFWNCTAFDHADNRISIPLQKLVYSLNPLIIQSIRNNLTLDVLTRESMPLRGEVFLPNSFQGANISWLFDHDVFRIEKQSGIMERTPDSMEFLLLTANISLPYVSVTKSFSLQFAPLTPVTVVDGYVNTSASEILLTENISVINLFGSNIQYVQLSDRLIRTDNRKDANIQQILMMRKVNNETVSLFLSGGIIGPLNWNALFTALHPINASIPGMIVHSSVKLGSDVDLNFSSLATLTFNGMAGKRAGFIDSSGVFVEITNGCSFPLASRECVRTTGDNLQILTLHATQFIVFTPIPSSGGDGGGAGGGGGSDGGGAGGASGGFPPIRDVKKEDNLSDPLIVNHSFVENLSDLEVVTLVIPGVYWIDVNRPYEVVFENSSSMIFFDSSSFLVNNESSQLVLDDVKFYFYILGENDDKVLVSFEIYEKNYFFIHLIWVFVLIVICAYWTFYYWLDLKLLSHITKLKFERKMKPFIDYYFILRAHRSRRRNQKKQE